MSEIAYQMMTNQPQITSNKVAFLADGDFGVSDPLLAMSYNVVF